MFFTRSSVLAALTALVAAHIDHHHHAARQLTSSTTSASRTVVAGTSSGASSTASTAPSTASSASAASSAVNSSTFSPPATTFSFTLLATNPTAVPLASITFNQSSLATVPLDTTAVPGAQPTLAGAPPLPNFASLSPSNYPALDLPPPTDSQLVQQWIQDVANSGFSIPNIPVNSPGGCPNNTAAAADSTRCWWTCGGCTRDTDITTCPNTLQWGLTYDDGPGYYTPNLLDYLDQTNLKSTFFVVGSRAIQFPAYLQAEYMGNHQIAVHTWSHTALTTQTNEEIIAELGWSKKVIKDVLGVTPNMMRPPYGDIDDRVRAISIAMGLTPVIWTRISPTATFDTGDFNIHGGSISVEQVLQNWEYIISNATAMSSGFIVLEHDLFQQTVEVATGYILPDALAHQPPFTIEPIISCLNKPMTDAYIETNNNKTNPPLASGSAVTTLSSGAPGSAQSTGTAKSAASDPVRLNAGYGFTLLGGLAGLAAAIWC